MFWFIAVCVSIAALMLSYRVEIESGGENKLGRYLALIALGISLGYLYATIIAV